MILNGHINGLKKGTVLLERYIDTGYVAIDSVRIYGDSNFELQQTIESPEILHLYLRLENGTLLDDRVSFFAEPGEISLYTKLEDFSNPNIEGSKNHDLLMTYSKIAERYKDRNLDLIAEGINALRDGNDSLAAVIENKKKTLTSNSYLATVNFALQNSDYEVAPFIMMYITPDINVRYLDTVYNNLSDKAKNSIYGQQLETRIAEIKEEN